MLGIVMAGSCAYYSEAQTVTATASDGYSQVVVKWSGFSNHANASYTVTRIGNNKELVIAEGVQRLQFIDTGVLPGTYTYKVSNGSQTQTSGAITMGERDFSKPNYSLDVVYEATLSDYMNEWRTMGNVDYDESADKTDELGVKGQFLHANNPNWVAQYNGENPHDCSSRSLNQHNFTNDYLGQVKWVDKTNDYATNNGQVLDGNRYIWLDQMPHFDENVTGASEAYLWAARGMSWRGTAWSGTATSSDNPAEVDVSYPNGQWGEYGDRFRVAERCWYIPIREGNVTVNGITDNYTINNGIICIWDVDRKTKGEGNRGSHLDYRPYHGAPFYLDMSRSYKAFGSDFDWGNKDQFYSLVMSDNGRSYMHRAGSTPYSTKPASDYYNIAAVRPSGHAHVWHSYSDGTFGRVDTQNSVRQPGNPCHLLSIKGNLGFTHAGCTGGNTSNTGKPMSAYTGSEAGPKAPKDFNHMAKAYVYMTPPYNADATTLRIRRDLITERWFNGFARIDLVGLNNFSKAYQNYVVPIAGDSPSRTNSPRRDFIAQIDGNYMVYVSDAAAFSIKEAKNEYENVNQGATGWSYLNNDLNADFQGIVGGCSFIFKGETFLVLPAYRNDKNNYGDFTVFRISGVDGTFKLTPIIDYKVPKVVPSADNYTYYNEVSKVNSKLNRTFFAAEVYENDGYVWICRYLPGHRIDKYRLSMQPIVTSTPKVTHDFTKENLPDNMSYKQHRSVIKTGLNENYQRVRELNAKFEWSTSGYNPWNNSTEYNTDWMLEEALVKQYYANAQGYNPSAGYNELRNGWTSPTGQDYRKGLESGFGLNHEMSIHAQSVLIRRHNGFTERAVGQNGYANAQANYESANPSLKAYVLTNQANGEYLVELDFEPAPAVSATYADGSYITDIPVDYYTVYCNDQQITDFNTIIGDENQYFLQRKNAAPGMDRAAGNSNVNYLVGQDKIWGDYNFGHWNLSNILTHGNNVRDTKAAVLFYTTRDASVKNAKFKVMAHYAAAANHDELKKYGQSEATVIDQGTTGVEDIVSDSDDNAVYYTIDGIEVPASRLTSGVYVRVTSAGATKILVR